jgi:GGDEF domain-containing protein
LSQTLGRQERQGGSFALLMFDIDHFKKLNDTYGHPAGTRPSAARPRCWCATCARATRRRGTGERVRGHPAGADEKGAAPARGARARGDRGGAPVFEGARLNVTVSLGVAIWPDDAKDDEGLIAAADRALYAAKQGGRNRVVTASSLPPADSSPSH